MSNTRARERRRLRTDLLKDKSCSDVQAKSYCLHLVVRRLGLCVLNGGKFR